MRAQGAYFEGDRGVTSLPYVQPFLYHIFSSINVSISHITWLDTFWTDLAYMHWFISEISVSVPLVYASVFMPVPYCFDYSTLGLPRVGPVQGQAVRMGWLNPA